MTGRSRLVPAVAAVALVSIGLWLARPPASPVPTDGASPVTRQESTTDGGSSDRVYAADSVPDTPTGGRDTAEAQAGDEPVVPTIEIMAYTSTREILAALGIDRDDEAWDAVRNVDPKAFDQFSDRDLRALAIAGDYGARIELMMRIAQERPLESTDMAMRLAAEGSHLAMQHMAAHYAFIADLQERNWPRVSIWADQTTLAMQQVAASTPDLRREALAWRLASEAIYGVPRGAQIANEFSPGARRPSPDEVAAACDRAAELLDDLEARRQAEGLIDPMAGQPPPYFVAFPAFDESLETACPYDALRAPDRSGCREFNARVYDSLIPGYACPEITGIAGR